MAATARRIARIHKLLGLVIGVQFLFWAASGLFFTLFPIETIHGDPWRPKVDHGQVEFAAVAINAENAAQTVDGRLQNITLHAFLGGPVWIVETDQTRAMVDAQTGVIRSPISLADLDVLIGRFDADTPQLGGEMISYLIHEDPLREYAGPLPAWVLEYEPGKQRIYIDAVNGEIKSVRTTKWRIFDVLWRFHILDVTGEDVFDSWWLKLAAFLGLTTVLFGFALLVDRARKGRLFS